MEFVESTIFIVGISFLNRLASLGQPVPQAPDSILFSPKCLPARNLFPSIQRKHSPFVFNGQISDFGTSQWTAQTTTNRLHSQTPGTWGYNQLSFHWAAPEVCRSCSVNAVVVAEPSHFPLMIYFANHKLALLINCASSAGFVCGN